MAFWLTRDTIDGLSESVARRQNKAATERRNDAEKALAQFSSITASRYGVAQTGSGGVAPMLFLPCPDNLGDNNLDGAADAPCGRDTGGDNLTNGALDSGSRFGRFPWRVRVTAEGGGGSISRFDFGFGADLRDAYGNRAWYAISKNIASHKPAAAPLYNFHHLHWRDKSRWLSLYDARGLLADDVAAVVLFPGQPLGDQIRDPIHENARATISVAVSAAAYFESTTARISATVWATISNADNDGRFVVAPAAADFNDEIALLRLSEMTAPSSPHYDAYIGLVGAPRDKTHNAPVAGSLLAGFAREVEDFYRAFRYYPHPAVSDTVTLTIENGLAGDCGVVPNSISIHTIGFWPDQEYPAMKLANSNTKMTVPVDLRGGFLHRGVLFESGNTIIIFPGDDIIVESGDYFRVEANVDKLSTRYLFDKIIVISNDESFAATITTTLTNVRTDARTYREAGFFLHATVTITASTPVSIMTVVQYPWRSDKPSLRVGQTKSPPCPDRRNFISERIADFARNHPLIYAAATTTGDGLTVEIAPDARVALPTAQTLTNTFTFTLRAGQISLSAPIDVEVRISGGTVTFSQPSIPNSIILLTDVDVFPVPAAMAMIRNLRAPSFSITVRAQARIRLPKNLVLTEGARLTVPRGAIARGGANSKFVGVRALVIWSPAPLAWADCQPPNEAVARVNQIQIESATGSTLSVTLQRELGAGATYRDLCHWLDDSENANEDEVFRISSIDEAGRDAHPRNDYFLLFGGVFSP